MSLKNGIELILTFVIFAQAVYLIAKVKPSPIYWNHFLFLVTLFCHFILILLYHYYGLYLFSTYVFYCAYGSMLLHGRHQLIYQSVGISRLFLNLVVTVAVLSIHLAYPTSNWIPVVFVMAILISNLMSLKHIRESRERSWFGRLNLYFLALIALFPIAHLMATPGFYLLFKIPYSILFLLFLCHNFITFVNSPRFFTLSAMHEREISDDQHSILKKIRTALEEEEVYKQNSLTINHLSESIQEPVYKISKLTNKHYGKTFPELVNHLRISDVKSKLTDPKFNNYKIEALAYESGFNTPSSFYAAFKKETGMTPNQVKKKFNRK